MGRIYIYACDICKKESRDISEWTLGYIWTTKDERIFTAGITSPVIMFTQMKGPRLMRNVKYICSSECQQAFLVKHGTFNTELTKRRIKPGQPA